MKLDRIKSQCSFFEGEWKTSFPGQRVPNTDFYDICKCYADKYNLPIPPVNEIMYNNYGVICWINSWKEPHVFYVVNANTGDLILFGYGRCDMIRATRSCKRTSSDWCDINIELGIPAKGNHNFVVFYDEISKKKIFSPVSFNKIERFADGYAATTEGGVYLLSDELELLSDEEYWVDVMVGGIHTQAYKGVYTKKYDFVYVKPENKLYKIESCSEMSMISMYNYVTLDKRKHLLRLYGLKCGLIETVKTIDYSITYYGSIIVVDLDGGMQIVVPCLNYEAETNFCFVADSWCRVSSGNYNILVYKDRSGNIKSHKLYANDNTQEEILLNFNPESFLFNKDDKRYAYKKGDKFYALEPGCSLVEMKDAILLPDKLDDFNCVVATCDNELKLFDVHEGLL